MSTPPLLAVFSHPSLLVPLATSTSAARRMRQPDSIEFTTVWSISTPAAPASLVAARPLGAAARAGRADLHTPSARTRARAGVPQGSSRAYRTSRRYSERRTRWRASEKAAPSEREPRRRARVAELVEVGAVQSGTSPSRVPSSLELEREQELEGKRTAKQRKRERIPLEERLSCPDPRSSRSLDGDSLSRTTDYTAALRRDAEDGRGETGGAQGAQRALRCEARRGKGGAGHAARVQGTTTTSTTEARRCRGRSEEEGGRNDDRARAGERAAAACSAAAVRVELGRRSRLLVRLVALVVALVVCFVTGARRRRRIGVLIVGEGALRRRNQSVKGSAREGGRLRRTLGPIDHSMRSFDWTWPTSSTGRAFLALLSLRLSWRRTSGSCESESEASGRLRSSLKKTPPPMQ